MAGAGGLLIIGLLGAAVAVASSSETAHAAPAKRGGGTGPGGAIELDKNMDPETQRAVLQALQTETDPAKLTALADAIGEKYPLASAALFAKAAALAAAERATHAAQAAVQGIPAAAATVATPAIDMPPETTPPTMQPTVTPIPTFIPPMPAPLPTPGHAPLLHPPPAPAQVGEPPAGPGTWVLASNADVKRDGVASRYASLLRQSVGTTVTEDHGEHTWQFRVISHQSDPGLTSYAKDVKGWIWHAGEGGGSSPIAHNTVPTVSPRTIATAPARNATIANVQAQLNSLGIAKPPLVVDGVNGPKTIAAVKLFQQQNGLVVDGIAGPKTEAALASAGSVPVSASPGVQPSRSQAPVPIVGAVASNKDVQGALNALGASPRLTVDGIMGPLTTAAVKAFQRAHGLTADGIAGPKTKAALTAALSNAGGLAISAGWGRGGWGGRGFRSRMDRERGFGRPFGGEEPASWNLPPDPAWVVPPGSPYGPVAPPDVTPDGSADPLEAALTSTAPAPPIASGNGGDCDELGPAAAAPPSPAVVPLPAQAPPAPSAARARPLPPLPQRRPARPLPPTVVPPMPGGPSPARIPGPPVVHAAPSAAPGPASAPAPAPSSSPWGSIASAVAPLASSAASSLLGDASSALSDAFSSGWYAPRAAPGWRPLVMYRRRGRARRAIP